MVTSPLKDIQLLVVDDQKLIRKLVFNILTAWGFQEIKLAKSGQEAIDFLKQQAFDLIITDWRMAEPNGLDLLRFVRTSPDSLSPNIPVIFLTGNAEYADVSMARDTGVTEYLIKPFSAAELINRVRSVIERPRSFVKAPTYRGPDRRRRPGPAPDGTEKRKKG
jgi:CheY-like chemotaxis protein